MILAGINAPISPVIIKPTATDSKIGKLKLIGTAVGIKTAVKIVKRAAIIKPLTTRIADWQIVAITRIFAGIPWARRTA